jgi:hypothetical protein
MNIQYNTKYPKTIPILTTEAKLNKKVDDKKEIIQVTYRLVQHSQIAVSLLHHRFCLVWSWNGSIASDP